MAGTCDLCGGAVVIAWHVQLYQEGAGARLAWRVCESCERKLWAWLWREHGDKLTKEVEGGDTRG